MEYEVFPSIYEAQLRKNECEYERPKNRKSNINVAQKEKKSGSSKKSNRFVEWFKETFHLDELKPNYFDKSFVSYLRTFCVIIGIILFFIVLFAGLIMLVLQFVLEADNSVLKIVGLILGIILGTITGAIAGIIAGFLGGAVYGCILGIVLCPIAYPIFRGICNSKIKKAEFRITQYTEGFEQEAQKLSVNFANSTLTKEIIEWLADCFLKKVRLANRASHIDKIVVPFDYYVYKGEIICDNGKYNFEEHRCEQLPNALAQAAFARAIASQVQSNMITKYNKDISGTEYKIDITYSYQKPVNSSDKSSRIKNCASVHLVYTASNGDYKPLQQW